jgi:hypothetical protein
MAHLCPGHLRANPTSLWPLSCHWVPSSYCHQGRFIIMVLKTSFPLSLQLTGKHWVLTFSKPTPSYSTLFNTDDTKCLLYWHSPSISEGETLTWLTKAGTWKHPVVMRKACSQFKLCSPLIVYRFIYKNCMYF